MAKYSILLASCMLAVYTTLLHFLPFRSHLPLHVQQGKYLIAENFLYDKAKPRDVVIVGSSMAERLEESMLKLSVLNLAISGERSTTGMSLLALNGKYPKVLLVEVNILTRLEDTLFLNSYQSSWVQNLKQTLPFLQERNQLLTRTLNGIHAIHPLVKKKPIVSSAVLNSVQNNHLALQNDTSQFKMIRQNVNELRNMVRRFSNKGIKIVLFRMPLEKRTQQILDKSKRVQFERKQLTDKLLNLPNVSMIPEDIVHEYHTTDGVHLIADDAQYFADYLLKNATLQ